MVVGDDLVRKGVRLLLVYGGTEFGMPVWHLHHGRTAQEWYWLEFCDSIRIQMIPRPSEDEQLYELAVHVSLIRPNTYFSMSLSILSIGQ